MKMDWESVYSLLDCCECSDCYLLGFWGWDEYSCDFDFAPDFELGFSVVLFSEFECQHSDPHMEWQISVHFFHIYSDNRYFCQPCIPSTECQLGKLFDAAKLASNNYKLSKNSNISFFDI